MPFKIRSTFSERKWNVRPESRPLFTIANAETFELIYSHEKRQGYHLSVVIFKMWGVQLRSNQKEILSEKSSLQKDLIPLQCVPLITVFLWPILRDKAPMGNLRLISSFIRLNFVYRIASRSEHGGKGSLIITLWCGKEAGNNESTSFVGF